MRILCQLNNDLLLATNNGSLFYLENDDRSFLVFASERYILKKLSRLKKLKLNLCESNIKHIKPNNFLIKRLDKSINTNTLTQDKLSKLHFSKHINSKQIIDHSIQKKEIKRCKKCILPETYPFIELDSFGICRYCKNHQQVN